jgi:hypothetical protein
MPKQSEEVQTEMVQSLLLLIKIFTYVKANR